MWPLCSFSLASALWLLIPLLLGLLTGWWIWANRPKLGLVGDGIDTVGTGFGSAIAGAGAVVGGAGAALAKGTTSAVGVGSTVVGAGAATAGGAVDVAKAAGSSATGTAAGVIGAVGAAAGLTAIGIPAAVGAADDLLLIKGVGPKLNGLLNKLGITRFDQIAAWSRDDVAKVDGHMENFSGRIDREEWIPQAKLLAAGNMTEFNRLYGDGVATVAAAGAVAMTAIGIPAAVGAADDLLQLKGVGPKLNGVLVGLGVTRFDQIAAWTAGDVAKVDEHLGSFKGRIVRESWVEQAGLLATGAIAAFEAKFGKLDSENV
jgi:predicted flap endonuclease-1-like 5' DNA nuclease